MLEMVLDIVHRTHILLGCHGIKRELLGQHLLYLLPEHCSHLIFPCLFLPLFIATIKCHNKQKVDIIVSYKESIPVKEAIGKLHRHELLLVIICQVDVVLHLEILLLRRNKEVRDDIIAFRHIISELWMLLLLFRPALVIKQVEIPLYHISGVCKLLIHRFLTYRMLALVILGVTYIIYLLFILIVGQVLIWIQMIHTLAITLILQVLW